MEDMALKLLIEQRRAQMPRDPLGISGIGTESANCELSREFKTLQTVDSQQCESAGNAEPSGEQPSRPAPGPNSAEVNSILADSGFKMRGDYATGTELSYDATYQYLRAEWPDENDVWPQLLHRIAKAVAFGDLSKEDLFDLVKKSKLDRIKKPGSHFCSTIKHYLPKKKKS